MLKATYFASMSLKLKYNVMRGSDIMADDFGVSGSGKKKSISKGRGRYSTGMAFEGSEKGFGLRVIYLSFSIGESYSQLLALWMIGQRADVIILLLFDKEVDFL
jgi:hypothetical protein